jgi:hypothetical protein
VLLVTAACSTAPPPNWQTGGALLTLADAQWERRNGVRVELRADGTVLENGRKILLLDPVGRIVDRRHEPVALLSPAGTLIGAGDEPLGHVGLRNAAPPNSGTAWLALAENGAVTRFTADGDRRSDGAWTGCTGHVVRTCTLISHLITLANAPRRQAPSFGVGVGVVVP